MTKAPVVATTLQLGPGCELPLEAITETIAILGIRGSGKTNSAVVLAEELRYHDQQVVVIDPTDVWWGLRSSADGTASGYPVVVLGGKHGDVPLAATDGKVIADFVVDRRASVVLSTRHFESQADARRFVTDFAARLYYRKGQQESPTPIMIIIDEASLFVPQRVMGEEAKCVGAIQKLVRQGRSSGIGVTLIDQRPASVNKDVLSMLELLICHRTTGPQDRKALTAWVEQHDTGSHGKEFLAQLAGLPRGTAWFWSPGWLDLFRSVAVRARRTFDSSRTPKAGERAVAMPAAVTPVDVEALRTQLAQTIAAAEADDPKKLRARIQELGRELVAAKRAAPAIADALDAERFKLARADGGKEAIDSALAAIRLEIAVFQKNVVIELEGLREKMSAANKMPDGISNAVPAPTRREIEIRRPPSESARAVLTSAARAAILPALTGPEQKILDALAWLASIGVDEPEQAAVAFVAGYTVGGGSYNNTRSKLKVAGLIEYAGDRMRLTTEGALLANQPAGDVSGAALRQRVFDKLPGPESKIYSVLIDRWPHAVPQDELAQLAGYSAGGGAFNNPRSRLRTLGLIDYPRAGFCRARDILFPDDSHIPKRSVA